MTLLLPRIELAGRRAVVAGALSPLVDSLSAEMERVLREAPPISGEKALLSREGGRCATCGAALSFDPYAPQVHRCPMCNAVHIGERQHRWWIMFAQLWRAERAVHAAALHALRDVATYAAFARATLDEYADRYPRYPNSDNVLGPSRPFFSTYLESIWLLQLCIAADILDAVDAGGAATGHFRDRVAIPSAALIRSYDEGDSNRQLWNNAAMLAAAIAVGDRSLAEHAVHAPSGLIAHLDRGLLSDGTWYEGENYHLFAHRGLWYGVTMAEAHGFEIPRVLRDRFQAGFSTPFLTALPDLTFPARRDSQYGASLRQWRTAESCELGLARAHDSRLTAALASLYADNIPRIDTGRWRSAAESERNEPATALDRSDLGWRSLLFAREQLPLLARQPMPSALLEGQGIAVFRRRNGEGYAALDYGHHGGSHGHPDRLNVLLAHGAHRILDDMGTGSYVDPSLHWYRSTLAHNAPLIDGRSQPRISGVLRAYEERAGLGWVCATASFDDTSTVVARALTSTEYAVIDELRWESTRSVRLELPFHAPVSLEPAQEWTPGTLDGGEGLEDGFAHVREARFAHVKGGTTVRLVGGESGAVVAWVSSDVDCEWWSVLAPGPPGSGDARFLIARLHGASGRIRTVFGWPDAMRDVNFFASEIAIVASGGAPMEYSYSWRAEGARIVARDGAGSHDSVATLAGFREPPSPPPEAAAALGVARVEHALPLVRELGEEDYRASEQIWRDARSPHARVVIDADAESLLIDVEVRKSPLVFRAANAPDPALDNEEPDINSDGVQLHLWSEGWPAPVAWLLVPEPGGSTIRVRQTAGGVGAPPLVASWRQIPGGYTVRLALPRTSLSPVIAIDVLVNDMAPGRERRRGQLVLSGARGERVYLRGDRQPLERLVRVRLPT